MNAFQQKVKLLQGVITGEAAFTGPFYVTVDITCRCNIHCVSCLFHSPLLDKPSNVNKEIQDIPYDLFKRLCNELKVLGTRQIILCGEGEPFLHPRLFDLVSAAKDTGFSVILYTNGTLLDEAGIKQLIDLRLDILKVSFFAGSPEEYQNNYPIDDPANYRKVVEGLKLLAHFKAEKKSKLPLVTLCHPINKNNFRHIDAMAQWAHTTGCNAISFTPHHNFRGGYMPLSLSKTEEKFVLFSLHKVKKSLNAFSIEHNVKQLLRRYKIGEAVWEKLPCYIGWFHATTKMDGRVFPCCRCDLPMGNLHEQQFHEIWNNSAYRTFRKTALTCRGLASMAKQCDCAFCGYVGDNVRVHNIFRWVRPFSLSLKREK